MGTNSFSFIDLPDTTIYSKKTAFFELFHSRHLLVWCAMSVKMVKSQVRVSSAARSWRLDICWRLATPTTVVVMVSDVEVA